MLTCQNRFILIISLNALFVHDSKTLSFLSFYTQLSHPSYVCFSVLFSWKIFLLPPFCYPAQSSIKISNTIDLVQLSKRQLSTLIIPDWSTMKFSWYRRHRNSADLMHYVTTVQRGESMQHIIANIGKRRNPNFPIARIGNVAKLTIRRSETARKFY